MSFSASPIPNAKKTFVDANGAPLAGGSVGYYVPSTLNAKTTWADENQATPNPTVITLDAAGRPQTQVFGSGDYREIVKDINGNTIWDAVTNIPQVGTSVTGTELITTGNVTVGAWTTFGIRVQLQSATYTDTTSTGTIPVVVVDAHNTPTIAASNAVTYTNAYTQYVSVPTAGANVTFTAAWAIGADSLKVNGNALVTGVLQTTGNRFANFSTATNMSFSTASATLVQCGFGAAGSPWKLTPSFSGRVRIRVTGVAVNTTAITSQNVQLSYGTGAAPAQGAAATGTTTFAPSFHVSSPIANANIPFAFEFELTGLTLNTAYWFDLQIGTPLGGTMSGNVVSVVIEEF